jgi:phage terminase large subunit-like protein
MPSGARRFKKALLWISKKNGKTLLAAAVSVYMLRGSGEAAPRVYCAASTKEQAKLLWDEAESMVLQDPFLQKEVFPIKSKDLLKAPGDNPPLSTGEMYVCASKIPKHLDGKNILLGLIDELHAALDRRIIDIFRMGTVGRSSGGLTLILSTTGEDDKGPLLGQVDIGRRILDPDGSYVDISFLPVLYTAPEEYAWDSYEAAEAANPSLGVTIKWEALASQLPECRIDPVARAMYERKHLNRVTGSGVGFFDMIAWDGCGGGVVEEDLVGKPCWGGLDYATRWDFTAFVMLFFLGGGRYAVKPHFWLPEESAARVEQATGQPIFDWADLGLLELTPGRTTDRVRMAERIQGYAKKFDMQEIGFDLYQLQELAQRLQDEYGLKMMEVDQNYGGLDRPTKDLQELVLNRGLAHGGNPILRWHAKCARTKRDRYENVRLERPDRERGPDRIDGVAALVFAKKVEGLYPAKPKRKCRVY